MINRIALLVVAGLLSLYGAYVVLQAVRSVRAPREYPGALMYWDERPAGTFSVDPGGWLAVLIHRLALITIGLMALLIVLRPAPVEAPLSGAANQLGWLADIVEYGAMGVIGFLAGISIFGPLAEELGGDRHYAVSPDGLLLSGQLLPWAAFSHFELDPGRNLVHVWSASLPGSPGMVAAPSAAGAARKLAEILAAYLPSSSPSAPGVLSWLAFPALMGLLCAPFLALAWWLLSQAAVYALSAEAILMWALLALGGRLIERLIYGGKSRPLSSAPSGEV